MPSGHSSGLLLAPGRDALGVALLDSLTWARDAECAIRNILGDHGARGHRRALADPDGRDEHRVAAVRARSAISVRCFHPS